MTRLDEPLSINGMQLRNRLVLAPMTNNFGSQLGHVTPGSLGFYEQRSRHVGLVDVEAAAVRPDGRITAWSLGLWDEEQIPGMRRLAETIKGQGAAAVVQLVHAGARAFPVEAGIRGASPSGFAFRPDLEPTELNQQQMAEIARDFATAAERAIAAGFDGVELHAAHFYLVSQFISPLTNRRTDRYGGDAVGRASFAVEVVKTMRARLGAGIPILVRVNSVEMVEGGQKLGDAVTVAAMLEKAGADAIHASLIPVMSWKEIGGKSYPQGSSSLPKDQPDGAAVPYAARIKQAVRIPVIAVGKLSDPRVAARVVAERSADLVAIGRQMIVDPDAAAKMLSGRGDEIIPCKQCLSCSASLRKRAPMVCATNKNLAGTPQY